MLSLVTSNCNIIYDYKNRVLWRRILITYSSTNRENDKLERYRKICKWLAQILYSYGPLLVGSKKNNSILKLAKISTKDIIKNKICTDVVVQILAAGPIKEKYFH